jgi:hypothetical protein
LAWHAFGTAGAALLVVTLTGVLGGMAWIGAPPWSSSVLSSWGASSASTGRVVAFSALCGATVALVGMAPFAGDPDIGAVLAWVGVALGELTAAMALAGVRQWRFAPLRRYLDAGIVTAAAIGMVLVFPGAADGKWWAPGIGVVLLALVVAIGRPLLARSDDAHRPVVVDAR